jgi:hypothetical protein
MMAVLLIHLSLFISNHAHPSRRILSFLSAIQQLEPDNPIAQRYANTLTQWHNNKIKE